MKRILLLIVILTCITTSLFSQSSREEKKAAIKAKKESEIAANSVKYEKAVAAIQAKDFVIFIDRRWSTGSIYRDIRQFLSYEKGYVYLQSVENTVTNKLTVSNYNQTTAKNGDINISMFVKGFYIHEKVDIFLKNGNNWAEVIIGNNAPRFSGELLPRAESNYFMRPDVI